MLRRGIQARPEAQSRVGKRFFDAECRMCYDRAGPCCKTPCDRDAHMYCIVVWHLPWVLVLWKCFESGGHGEDHLLCLVVVTHVDDATETSHP
jgi:hypothetical protein